MLITEQCIVADCFFDRLRGLIGKTVMEPEDAMFFPRCNDIHMWFMKIPIDIVFLRREVSEGKASYWVCSTFESVQPWRVLPLRDSRATDTLELAVGTIQRFEICIGDELCLS